MATCCAESDAQSPAWALVDRPSFAPGVVDYSATYSSWKEGIGHVAFLGDGSSSFHVNGLRIADKLVHDV